MYDIYITCLREIPGFEFITSWSCLLSKLKFHMTSNFLISWFLPHDTKQWQWSLPRIDLQ